MPYNSQYRPIIDDLLSISITFLKANDYLIDDNCKSGMVYWSTDNEVTSSISVCVDMSICTMFLNYRVENNSISDSIKLLSVPSNLGKGLLWYFKCPTTKKRCRKLHLYNGHFVGRGAIDNALYKVQTKSKSWRSLYQYLNREEKCGELVDKLEKPYSKRFYNGKPTKKVHTFRKLARQLNDVDIDKLFKI